jgi:hypothetical protein
MAAPHAYHPSLAALALAAALSLAAPPAPAAPTSYLGRPVYSEPAIGLQLPPACVVEPTWRAPLAGAELEVWVATCDGLARVWLLRRQVIEVLGAREARLRFQVIDERILPEDTAGDTLSVQCTGPDNLPGLVVRGARWRTNGRELHLASAAGAMRGDIAQHRLIDLNLGAIDCTRFPDREAMMRKLQQADHPPR